MTYLVGDVAYFVQGAPYLALAQPTSAIEFLERALRRLGDCYVGLDGYPSLRVESLEFFYITARSLGMLDPGSLRVMTTELTWRGVVWGGWLALMRPSPAFKEILADARAPRPANLMWAQCALALLEQRRPPPHLLAIDALAARVREAVGVMSIERMPLRAQPAGDDLCAIADERRRVHAAYKSGGAERALQALRGTRLGELAMPYPRWYRLQVDRMPAAPQR